MKKLILMLVLLIGGVSVCLAQHLQEVVYLKNGSVIRGIIIEQIPNESLKIQTNDGNIFVYNMSEVEKITKETRRPTKSFSYTPNGEGAKKGYKGFVDFGYTAGVGTWGEDKVELATSHGYQFNPYFFIGGGIGIHRLIDSDYYCVPIFANIRANILNNKITPFFDLKIGYSSGDVNGFYFNPSVGGRFGLGNKNRMGINISLGYVLQNDDVEYGEWYYEKYDETRSLGGITLKVGLEF